MLHIIQVIRYAYDIEHTKSLIFIDNNFFGYGLEPPNIKGPITKNKRDCIQKGTYDVKITYSSTLKRNLPEIINIPHQTGIRIHAGNYPKDTNGCLLIGYNAEIKSISDSTRAINKLNNIIYEWEKKGDKIKIIIEALNIEDISVEKWY